LINALSLYSDKGILGDYRVRLPAQAVTDKRLETGVHVEASNRLDVTVRNGVVIRVGVPGGVKVVSFQRPARQLVSDVIVWLRHYRPDVAIMVDVDDQIPQLDDEWPLKRSVALADVVTVSTDALAQRYGYAKDRTFVIRNAVPSEFLQNPSSALSRKRSRSDSVSDRTVGWSGSALSQAKDLAETRGTLASVVGVERRDGRRVTFRSIGPRAGLSEALSLPEGCIEVPGMALPTGLYRVALGEIDIAIVPQADQASGGTQALEFAAAGCVVVASDTPEHRVLKDGGLPLTLVGSRKKDWLGVLRSMVAMDDRKLKELAAAHRENVRLNHTVERRVYEWAHAYRTAYQIAKET
jgi:hypothetical protein